MEFTVRSSATSFGTSRGELADDFDVPHRWKCVYHPAKSNRSESKSFLQGFKKAPGERFCGDDYKRTLETQLRGLQCRKNVNINNLIHKLRNTIKELDRIKDESAMESLAVNHVISNLEPALLNEVRVLQLATTLTLNSKV